MCSLSLNSRSVVLCASRAGFCCVRLRTEEHEDGREKKKTIDVILCVRFVKEMHKNKMTWGIPTVIQ